jgi:hypothetical protein
MAWPWRPAVGASLPRTLGPGAVPLVGSARSGMRKRNTGPSSALSCPRWRRPSSLVQRAWSSWWSQGSFGHRFACAVALLVLRVEASLAASLCHGRSVRFFAVPGSAQPRPPRAFLHWRASVRRPQSAACAAPLLSPVWWSIHHCWWVQLRLPFTHRGLTPRSSRPATAGSVSLA